MENDSQTLNLKLNLKSRALETKVTKLEAELKKKDEKICEVEQEVVLWKMLAKKQYILKLRFLKFTQKTLKFSTEALKLLKISLTTLIMQKTFTCLLLGMVV